MAKNKVSEWSATASNNTDISGINIAEGCAPSGINNAIRELMAQVKDMQTGADGDGLVVGGAFTASGAAVFSSTVALGSSATATTPSAGDNSTKVATTAYADNVAKFADPGSNGVVVRTALNTSTARTITAGTSVSVLNGTGVSGNPTISVTDASITATQLASDAVETAKIKDANVTAAKLSGAQSGSAPIYGARAWVNFDGSGSISANQTIRASGNVSSVYKTANGTYEINFTTAMQDANYAIVANAMGGQEAAMLWVNNASSTQTAEKATIQIRDSNDPASLTSPTTVWVAIFR